MSQLETIQSNWGLILFYRAGLLFFYVKNKIFKLNHRKKRVSVLDIVRKIPFNNCEILF